MSRLDELIQELCPDGVEQLKISEVTNYEQPSKYIVDSTDYSDDFNTPVLTAGQTFILGYTNETEGIYEASKDKPVIIFDDFTGALKWVDFPFKVKSSALKLITANNKILIRYLYHTMENIGFTSDEHKRLWISIYSEIKVAVPPLEVQREVVRILDSFTLLTSKLTSKLTAELTARKSQYEFYRRELLTFDESIPQLQLRDVASFRNGKGHEKNIEDSGKYVVINSKFISTNGQVIKNSDEQLSPLYIDDIAMVMSDLPNGRALAKCYLINKNDKFTLNQRIGGFHTLDEHKVVTKYLFYILDRNWQLLKYDNGVDQTNLKKDDILNISIPVPSIDVQKRLVHVLDNFDMICSDLNIGLPAEIEARQKQYEFYRDALLTYAATGKIIAKTDRQTDRQTAEHIALIKLCQYVFGAVFVNLSDIAEYSKQRISASEVNADTYVGVDNLLPNRKGKKESTYVPDTGNMTRFDVADILIGNIRPYLKKIWFSDCVGGTNGDVLAIHPISEYINPRFLYHILSSDDFFNYDMQNAKGTKMPRGNKEQVMKYPFAIPSLDEQERIVGILDRFDTLCNDLSIGLPAEIEARQKQYEYYRDRLLNFEPITE